MMMDIDKFKECLFLKNMNRITVDMDDIRDVPKALAKAIKLFGKENVSLYVTASGVGFRIHIKGKFTPLENIFYRALLEDDPYRLRYAIRRYFSTGNINVLDIAFIMKSSFRRYFGRVRRIDLDLVYDEDYNKCLEKLIKVIDNLYSYTIVVEVNDNLLEILKDVLGRYKIIRDPYHENRVIVQFIARDDDLLNELKEKLKVIKVMKTRVHTKE